MYAKREAPTLAAVLGETAAVKFLGLSVLTQFLCCRFVIDLHAEKHLATLCHQIRSKYQDFAFVRHEVCLPHSMPQVKPQRGARDPPYPPPGQFQAPAAYKSASSRPGRAKARTWVRPQSAEQSTPVSDPTPAPIQVAQQTVGTFISSLSKSVQVNQTGVASASSQQASYVSSKRNTLTRVQPGFASNSVPKSGPTSQSVSQATRRLIHQGRYKLIQQPQQTSRPQAGFRSTPTALQQYRQFVSTQSRKRAATSVCAPAAKRANIWVRSGGSSAAVASKPATASTSSSNSSAASYVRSTHSRKLQLVRRCPSNALTVPVTPVSRLRSRGTVLAKHLLSVRSLKRARRPALNVRQGGIAKPGKLQRIDGVLYKVGGSGLGRSLQRQVTPKAVRPLLSPEVRTCHVNSCASAIFHV